MALFINSILAGISIAIGCILYIMVENRIAGAILFSTGLLNVRQMGLPLYTGQIQNLVGHKINGYKLAVILLGNLLGTALISLCARGRTEVIVAARYATPMLEVIMRAILCGYLMTIATRENAPLWLSIMCVAGFILGGGYHVVADCLYVCANGWTMYNMCYLCMVAFGNLIGGIIAAKKVPEQPGL